VNNDTKKRTAGHNSTYPKVAVQWLNEGQFFNQIFVQVDSFVLRNPLLFRAHKRLLQTLTKIKRVASILPEP